MLFDKIKMIHQQAVSYLQLIYCLRKGIRINLDDPDVQWRFTNVGFICSDFDIGVVVGCYVFSRYLLGKEATIEDVNKKIRSCQALLCPKSKNSK